MNDPPAAAFAETGNAVRGAKTQASSEMVVLGCVTRENISLMEGRLMFVGHYGPSFAAKAIEKSIPLWVLFLAVQLLDVLWGIFVLLGIEKVRIVPGITATSPLDLYYMPYTHSLDGALFWSLAAGIVYYVLRRGEGWASASLVGGAVFSHWVLDVLVHRPDMPLYDNSAKIGLGLWNYPLFEFVLELAVLLGGMYLYLRSSEPLTRIGRYGMPVFASAMLALQAVVFFAPPPSSPAGAAISALVSYFLLAGIAWWLEQKRAPVRSSQLVGGTK